MKCLYIVYRNLTCIVIVVVVVVTLPFAIQQVTFANGSTSQRMEPGIYYSQKADYRLSQSQKKILEASLRRITGWHKLTTNKQGRLLVNRPDKIAGGSDWARRVLRAVIRSGHRFVIEDHSNSPTVNFGQLDEGMKYSDYSTGTEFDIYRVRLDFEDFQQVHAEPAVKAAFDEGFAVFHELLHGLGLQDTGFFEEIGDCEEVVNNIRTDLGLPLRDQYLGDVIPVTSRLRTIRLRFKSPPTPGEATARWKNHYLFFVVHIVSDEQLLARPVHARRSSSGKERILASFH